MEVGETLSILDEDGERADAAHTKLFNCITEQIIELIDVIRVDLDDVFLHGGILR
jgi:hypothetical protein